MYYLMPIFLFLCMSQTHALSCNLIYTTTKNDIRLTAHIMQPHECSNLFFHNLHAYHLYPIKLVIHNNTQKTWFISGNSIEELLLVPPKTIARDIIFQYTTTATLTAYGCALTGWIGTLAGINFIREYLPKLANTTKLISAGVTLLSFLYQAHLFAIHQSNIYKQTEAHIIDLGLSGENIIIHPGCTITKVMFLNDKSYQKNPTPKDTFFYLFNVKLYNFYDSTDITTLPVELPKANA